MPGHYSHAGSPASVLERSWFCWRRFVKDTAIQFSSVHSTVYDGLGRLGPRIDFVCPSLLCCSFPSRWVLCDGCLSQNAQAPANARI